MITNGWLDWCPRTPGPGNKGYPVVNAGAGIVWHSMEGWYAGSLAELMKPTRAASWMFSLKLNGDLIQHYPITASPWASGNRWANTTYWSVELEGVQSMPINPAQMRTALRLIDEWENHMELVATRGPLAPNMREHREVATAESPNAGPTACPSERYAPLWAALGQEEDDAMTPQERAEVDAIIRALTGMARPDGVAAIVDWNTTDDGGQSGNSLLAGYVAEQQKLAEHVEDHPGGSEVGNHQHVPGDVF